MRRYEQIFILRPSLGEEEITKVIENSEKIVLDQGGAIISQNKWGMRKMAYPIKKEPQGYYVFSDFAATPGAVAEIERKFRIDDAVLKYLTVKISDNISAEEITEAQDAASSKAAASEALDDSSVPEEVRTAEDNEAPTAAPSKAAASEALDDSNVPEEVQAAASDSDVEK